MAAGDDPPRSLWLTRELFSCVATDACHFPPEDAGFKGSAWHGRIDNAFRRDSYLASAFQRSENKSLYWLETPADRTDAPHGPFLRHSYEIGYQFPLWLYVAGEGSRDAKALQQVQDAVARSGVADSPYSAAAGFVGRFRIETIRHAPVTLRQLDEVWRLASVVETPLAQIGIELETMLRLGDGPQLDEAFAALARGEHMVPKLEFLAERAVNRLMRLPLGPQDEWHPWLTRLLETLTTHRANFQPSSVALYPFDAKRLSGKAHERHPIGGLLGHVQYRVPREALPSLAILLTLAEWCGVGRKTGLGLGRIRFSYSPET